MSGLKKKMKQAPVVEPPLFRQIFIFWLFLVFSIEE